MKNTLGKLTYVYALRFLRFFVTFSFFFLNFSLVNFLAWKQHPVNFARSKTEHFHTFCKTGKPIFANIHQSYYPSLFNIEYLLKTEAPFLLNIMCLKFSYTVSQRIRNANMTLTISRAILYRFLLNLKISGCELPHWYPWLTENHGIWLRHHILCL